MADINATEIANLLTLPRGTTGPGYDGKLRSTVATVEVSTATDTADEIRFALVPTNAVPRALRVYSDAAITSGAIDIGVYRYDEIDGTFTVADVDLFASALAVGGGLTGANQMRESGAIDIAEVGLPLWQLAGATADPGGLYAIVGTVTTDMGAAGTISVEFDYVV